jgi:hypothetical protein
MRSSFRLGKPKSAAQAVDSRPCSGIGRVALDVTGDADRGVPEQVSDRFDVHTGLKLGHGRAVPQCVHADVLNTGLTVCNLDRSQDVARLDRPPELGREHQTGVLPLAPARRHDTRHVKRQAESGWIGDRLKFADTAIGAL